MLNWLTRYAFVMAELRFDERGALTESVLDVGCGSHGLACAAANAQFVGIDVLFPGPVAPGMTALRSAPGPFPFDDASFETVVCLDVLEHLPASERRGFVRELARVASRRVFVACPSDESEWVQEVLRTAYSFRGLPLPIWLSEHDEHGLPSAADIHEACAGVEGFESRELAMTNGLLTTLTVMGDVLPEFAGKAAAEFRDHPQEWLELFQSARFGTCNRKGYVLERAGATPPKVSASNVRASVWASIRCPTCETIGLTARPAGAMCSTCASAFAREQTGAVDLTSVL